MGRIRRCHRSPRFGAEELSSPDPPPSALHDGARVAVIGGGPAGSFVALNLIRQSRRLGREIEVVILERRQEFRGCPAPCAAAHRYGCTYCAGGLSPRLNDAFRELQLQVPEDVIQGRIRSITVQGNWKNIEIEVPADREMLSVYRGARPLKRSDRCHNFDSFLLEKAVEAGARLITGEARTIERVGRRRLRVRYGLGKDESSLEATFVAVASGVNPVPGRPLSESPLLESLRELIPGFSPPRVRRALIFEVAVHPEVLASMNGELHFIETGSQQLQLEMSSLVPKKEFLTAVLVGRSIDSLRSPGDAVHVVREFLDLPQTRKVIHSKANLTTACVCTPYMVVGTAPRPFGDGVAVVGDLATARLYKDGILSAYQTSHALAQTLLHLGVDRASLTTGYSPAIRRIQRDNRYAAVVFLIHRIVFSSSMLSRIAYQAVISERKEQFPENRKLERVLWRIASGDDSYARILCSFLRPSTLWWVAWAGVLTTIRNAVTEKFLGLEWRDLGRFTTGVAKERFEVKRQAFAGRLEALGCPLPGRMEFERMYTIRIRAEPSAICHQLGQFGEPDRAYLRPRWVSIERVRGIPNQPGCEIRYRLPIQRFSYSLVLEQIDLPRWALYRVRDGFAKGGVLIFDVEAVSHGYCLLSIYVAFDFNRGLTRLQRMSWTLFRLLFPAYVHDVIWNHSLCKIKDEVETADCASLETEAKAKKRAA